MRVFMVIEAGISAYWTLGLFSDAVIQSFVVLKRFSAGRRDIGAMVTQALEYARLVGEAVLRAEALDVILADAFVGEKKFIRFFNALLAGR
jgi:hypothetical protein